MKRLKKLIPFILTISLAFSASTQEHEHDASHANESIIKLTPENISMAGITVTALEKKPMTRYTVVPGEIVANQDQTAIISPRIQAQVVKRLVNVGEQVTKNQPLVELSSVAVANAQSELLINASQWQRLKTLGIKIITKKSYEEAEIKFHQAYAKLLAYGLTNDQIKNFIASKQANKANGNFTLLAPIAGTVASANLIIGQMLEPGAKLYEITDESSLWVNALLSADNQYDIQAGTEAVINTGEKSVTGKVIQVHHQLDTVTRTQIVRIAITNTNDEFHAGEFVTCHIAIGKTEPVFAVPAEAVLQSPDGDNIVYVQIQPGQFEAHEIKIEYRQNNKVIISGIEAGANVVTKGAFFVNSEAQKSGFDAHNH